MASRLLAPAQAQEVTLSLFGGTDTEISPSDVPEGLSPDNQDLIFLPGDTSSRPGLAKLFAAPFGAVSVVYQKTYVQPNGNPLTLILTSDGKLWAEDVAASPGNYTQIGSTDPGLYAQSISAFGREYLAFSDLLHGQGVPLQFDGTNLDRVTQDGPGAPPSVADMVNTLAIAAGPGGATNGLTFAIAAAPNGLKMDADGLVTVTLNAPPSSASLLQVGDQFSIAGAGVAAYDGTWAISAILRADSSQFQFHSNVLGLAASGGGNVEAFIFVITTAAGVSAGDAAVLDPNIVDGSWLARSAIVTGVAVGGYNGTWSIRQTVYNIGPTTITCYLYGGQFGLGGSGAGTIGGAGTIAVGQHQCVQMFLTRQGALTRPSPSVSWSAAGGKRVLANNLAIGPSNVVARVLAFTGAGGANFFTQVTNSYLPNPSGQPIFVRYFVVPNNSSTSAQFDFSDNALFAGIPIDVIGNDLFDQVALGPVLGFFGYGSRLGAWGDYNKIEGFLNLGFSGGYLSGALTGPLGWDASGNVGGILVNGGSWAAGMSWQITGDGVSAQRGLLAQGAYLDSFGDGLLALGTLYSARLWAKASAPNLAGTLIIEFSSASLGTIATATFQASAVTTGGGFLPLTAFNNPIASLPPDIKLNVYASHLTNLATLTISEIEIIPSENPYRTNLSRWSYVLNPEAFAQTTGNLGAADDDSPIQNFSLQRNVLELHSSEGTHESLDNGYEPGDGTYPWPVDSLTRSVGALSLRACDPGKFGVGDAAEDWDLIASRNGLYLHIGQQFYKVSQEITRTLNTSATAVTWDDINWAAQQTIWVKNDVQERRAYVGAPVNGASAPNVILVLDYRELDTASQIASAMPLHITLAGKMKSSDLTRKWTHWNVKANSAEILVRPGNDKQIFFGGGSGSTPGTGVAYGNIYSLDPAKLSDDDYGQISPYYITYAFPDDDEQLELGVGSGIKFIPRLAAYVTGVGLVRITPLINSLSNPLPSLSQRQLTKDTDLGTALSTDLEWTTAIRGQRVFFKISVDPLPGTTDVQIKLQKLVVAMMKNPTGFVRQSMI